MRKRLFASAMSLVRRLRTISVFPAGYAASRAVECDAEDNSCLIYRGERDFLILISCVCSSLLCNRLCNNYALFT